MSSAKYYIEKLSLIAHPEGGYYKETFRSTREISKDCLSEKYQASRNLMTQIYFLIESHNFSSFHKLSSDETWHFYDGNPVYIYLISPNGEFNVEVLGRDMNIGQKFQFTIPAETWFAAEVKTQNGFCLIGCTVAPGFHFDDFKLAKRQELIEQFPQHQSVIHKMTRS